MTKRLTVSCLVYGQEYAAIFAGSYLTSFLDASNAEAVKDQIDFELFTDQPTLDVLYGAETFDRLRKMVPVTVRRIPRGAAYDHRYQMQALQIANGVANALETGSDWMCSTADSCFGAGVFQTIVTELNDGHDAVIGAALRTTAEYVTPQVFQAQRALPARDLFSTSFPYLHPIWVASIWDSHAFTSIPYCLCWTDGQQLLVRKPSIDAWAIRPKPELKGLAGCSDMVLWRHATEPVWHTEWAELPIVLTEPLHCFYPPWQLNHRATIKGYAQWASQHIAPDALKELNTTWRFAHPDTPLNPVLQQRSDQIIRAILREQSRAVA